MVTITKNKRLVIFLIGIMVILCVTLVAMLFTSEVDWNLRDFLVAGSLLIGTALSIEFIVRRIKNINHRIYLVMALLIVLLLVWIEWA